MTLGRWGEKAVEGIVHLCGFSAVFFVFGIFFLGFTLLFPVVFYLVLMGLLVARFGHLPNYVTPYDWFGNVARIVAGTGSISDVLKIAMDEWLFEIGFMNYAYGRGVFNLRVLV